MRHWQWVILIVVTILIVIAGVALFVIPVKAPTVGTNQQATSTPTAASIPDLIIVSTPTIGAQVSSPLMVTGSARGSWYFEASFPAKLLDASGKVIAQTPGTATSDWMTSDFVPFTVTLTFAPQPAGSKGTLVLQNDNPSGLPEHDKVLEIPVVFK